ncbi:hypothetical protein F0243_27700 [Vibrio mediterranei]|nr:hypothetical protein [Vibrio mediterranei]
MIRFKQARERFFELEYRAMIHNTSFLVIKGSGLGLGNTVIDLLQGVGVNDASFRIGLDSILVGELKNRVLSQSFAL